MDKAGLKTHLNFVFFIMCFSQGELTFQLTLEEKETVFTFKFWLQAYGWGFVVVSPGSALAWIRPGQTMAKLSSHCSVWHELCFKGGGFTLWSLWIVLLNDDDSLCKGPTKTITIKPWPIATRQNNYIGVSLIIAIPCLQCCCQDGISHDSASISRIVLHYQPLSWKSMLKPLNTCFSDFVSRAGNL